MRGGERVRAALGWSCAWVSAERPGAGTDVRRQRRAHPAGTLAFWPSGAGLDSGDRRGKVGVLRELHPGACAGLLFGPGPDAVLPGNLRRSGRSYTVYLLPVLAADVGDRKSTRLNSSHRCISYAVFCLKKK